LDVVVLGGAAVDRVAQVNRLPARDSVVLACAQHRFAVGSAANVAVGLARLACRAGFIGRVGDDPDGVFLRQAFQEEGVDTRALLVHEGATTVSCFIAVDGQGERSIVALPGVSLIETAEGLDLAYVRAARVLYVGPSYPDVAQAAMTEAHASRSMVFYAPSGAWGPDGLAGISHLIQQCDVLLVSRTEAEALTGCYHPEQAVTSLHSLGPRVVVETLGAAGVIMQDERGHTALPSRTVTRVRDTTGAGDAFAAGFIASFLGSFPDHSTVDWAAAARQGCAAAAVKIGYLGARNGLPTRETLAHFMGDLTI
jgi:sugar/nucleoside kinase (ribokinase family)